MKFDVVGTTDTPAGILDYNVTRTVEGFPYAGTYKVLAPHVRRDGSTFRREVLFNRPPGRVRFVENAPGIYSLES